MEMYTSAAVLGNVTEVIWLNESCIRGSVNFHKDHDEFYTMLFQRKNLELISILSFEYNCN